eukprot:CAMPEP_0113319642 /NCGR_PEP_ID=MMETSP0010_2-20120614/13761_1 /TAXON_ID=216773 ORGANISM="Corethron hystrix, Strain 308" /NCGR_SAMPLE_ID=MMETSP0010_2 /ASSEMBLY_ACC=CAM_ASM_000155 /LENGTH=1280 /DNA_ID=CAMNT_0000177249 /DNA_START=110 /DNA_END=3953 /DNA_ORIENTATION=+ /assembly_acc=CAM_ASM_000155
MVFSSDSSRVSDAVFSEGTAHAKVSDNFVPRRHRPGQGPSDTYDYDRKRKDSIYVDNDREKVSDGESNADDESFATRDEGSYDSFGEHDDETVETVQSNETPRSRVGRRTSGIMSACGVGQCLDVLGGGNNRKTIEEEKKKKAPNPLFLFSRPKDGYESLLEHARVTSGQNVFDEGDERDEDENNPTPYERALEKKKDDMNYSGNSQQYDRDVPGRSRSKKFVPELKPAAINDITSITAPANVPGQGTLVSQTSQAGRQGADLAVRTHETEVPISINASLSASGTNAATAMTVPSSVNLEDDDLEVVKADISTGDSTEASPNSPAKSNLLGDPTDMKFSPANPTEAKLHADFLVCVRSIHHRKWDICEELVCSNPAVVSYTFLAHGNQTLLHIIAAQRSAVPIGIVSRMLAGNNEGVGTADTDGNLPLHIAASNASNTNILRLILNLFRAGAAIKNNNDDLPLHLAASCASDSEESVQLLLDAYADAIHIQNNRGQIPLHLVSSNERSSFASFHAILDVHKKSRADAPVLDKNGDSPLTNAIKSRVPHDFVKAFHDSQRNFVRIFLQPDGRGQLPLHLALQLQGVDPRIVATIIEAAPFTASVPTTSGQMPIQLATRNNMTAEVVKSLLLTDMPLDLGMKDFVGFKNSDLKQHSHSFWHVVVECDDVYTEVVKDVIKLATQPQVIALARSFGPDGKTRLAQAASMEVIGILRNALRLYERYELLSTKPPFIMDDVMTFAAIDQGGDAGVLAKYNKSSLPIPTCIGGDGVSGDRLLKTGLSCDEEEEKEVVLRCYYYKDAYVSEMTNRQHYKIDVEYAESIHAAHECHDTKRYSFCGGKLLTISIEKPDHTLAELYLQTKEKGKKWIRRKATDVLREVARCLEHVHSHGLVHGSINTSNVAKYGLDWKLRGIGGATPIGQPMSGPVKPCIPPEAIAKKDDLDSSFSSTESESEVSEALKSLNEIKDELEASVVEQLREKPDLSIEDSELLEDLNKLVSSKNEKRRKRVGFMFFRMDEIGLADKQGWHRHDDVEEKKAVKYIQTHATKVHDNTIKKLMDEISRLKLIISQHNKSNKALTEKDKEIKRLQQIVQKNVLRSSPTADLSAVCDYKLIAHEVLANPSWDVWSFGLIMAQLLLGRSVLLPNFEKDDSLLMENLYHFDKDKLERIRTNVTKVAGNRAGDLIARLLHPDPAKRLASFTMILQHKYFREDLVHNDALSTVSDSDNETRRSESARSARSSRNSVRGILKGGGAASVASSNKRSERDRDRERDDVSLSTFNL